MNYSIEGGAYGNMQAQYWADQNKDCTHPVTVTNKYGTRCTTCNAQVANPY